MRQASLRIPVLHALAPLLVCGAMACTRSGTQSPSADVPRNLLLITLDTTRADRLRCYGYAKGETPSLDALAARGVRVEQAIASVPLTRPSHATIMTGLLPHHHGVWSNGPYRVDASVPTLARRFRDAGFRTGAVVASFVLTRSFGFADGFDVFDDRMHEAPEADPEKSAGEVMGAATRWLGAELRPPFFLWLHFYDPHAPYAAPEPYGARFAERPYDGEVAYMDHAVGDVVEALRRVGWLEETLVMAVGDHGEGLGEHGEPTHGYFLYDSTVRVPLILAGPGVPNGRHVVGPVTLADVAPTLMEAFRVGAGRGATDGRSFWKELGRGAVEPRRALLENRTLHHQFGWAALVGVRTDRWKLVDAPVPELYDLVEDPGETRNIAERERRPATELRTLLASLRPVDGPSRPGALSPEQEERLSALGYAAGSSREAAALTGPDPKQFASLIGPIEELIRARARAGSARVGTLIEQILARDPSNLLALRVKGEHLLRQHRAAEALEVLRPLSARENHPETIAALAEASERVGDLAEAARWYQAATAPPWIHWPALEALARLSSRHPDRLPREDVLQKLGALAPESLRERISVARAFALLSVWSDAERWYRRALEADPRSSEALVGLAQVLSKRERHEEALEVASRVAPPTAESLFVRGAVRAALRRTPEACADFRAALPLAPGAAPNLLFSLGRRLADCAALDEAAQALEAARRAEPSFLDALLELARVEERRGRRPHAAALYREVLARAPADRRDLRTSAQERLVALAR